MSIRIVILIDFITTSSGPYVFICVWHLMVRNRASYLSSGHRPLRVNVVSEINLDISYVSSKSNDLQFATNF